MTAPTAPRIPSPRTADFLDAQIARDAQALARRVEVEDAVHTRDALGWVIAAGSLVFFGFVISLVVFGVMWR